MIIAHYICNNTHIFIYVTYLNIYICIVTDYICITLFLSSIQVPAVQRQVLLDHLERIFDLALVYHDFYAGALSEHGGPLRHRASLVKKLSDFVGETQRVSGWY